MNITVESESGLTRRMTVEIPEERVTTEVDSRLRTMTQSARIPGFRPGKVPLKVVSKRYGRQVRDEVVGEIVRSSFMDAVASEKLHPAGPPRIDPLSAQAGEGLSYTAIFEVYPEVSAGVAKGLKVERTQAEITEGDVENMIARLRSQRREWRAVDREAAEGDRLTVDFQGRIDGELFEGGSGEEMAIELGAGRMLPEFESGLVGAKAGDEREVELDFPADYHGKDVAGKHAVFKIQVSKVEEGQAPELNEDFIRSFGVEDGTMDAFHVEIRENMQRELDDKLRTQLKERVMDSLLEASPIDIPQSLVQEESSRLLRAKETEMRYQGIDPAQLKLTPEQFTADAHRRVALGIILGEVIKERGLQADADLVRARVDSIASSYEDPDEVRRFYYGNKERLSEIESAVMEDQVVAWILDEADVTDVRMEFDQVMNPMQTSV